MSFLPLLCVDFKKQNVNIMKTIILSMAFIAATLGANAQIGFGAQAGANLANLKSEFTSGGVKNKETGKTKVGAIVGVVANIPIASGLSFRPELNFIQKGAKFNSSSTNFGITSTSTENIVMNFVELPLNIAFSMPAGPGKFMVGAGPNVSFGISGNDKWENKTEGPGFPTQSGSGKDKIVFDGKKAADLPASDNDIHFKRVDFGANAIVGYKLDMGVFFTAGYTYGFSNLNPNPNSSLKTSGITLKVGYMIGGNSSSKED